MLNSPSIRIIFAMILAFTISSFVYFSFVNFYSAKIINHRAFLVQFSSGVYKYRFLGTYLLLKIYDFLIYMQINYYNFPLKLINNEVEPAMYLAFYILNTFFGTATAGAMAFLAENSNFRLNNSEKVILVALGVFIICITQFVIVPYDNIAYFLLITFFVFLMRYLHNPGFQGMFYLIVIIIISAANRESAALSLSLAATLFIEKWGLKRRTIKSLLLLGISFFAIYIGIRFLYNTFTTNNGSLFLENFYKAKNILGILFWLVFFVFAVIISIDEKARMRVLLFHILSLPYIAMCFYSGILYEVRLYVPIFITCIFISKLNLINKGIKISGI